MSVYLDDFLFFFSVGGQKKKCVGDYAIVTIKNKKSGREQISKTANAVPEMFRYVYIWNISKHRET